MTGCNNRKVMSRPIERLLVVVLAGLLLGIGVVALTRQQSHSADAATTGSKFDGPTMPPHLRASDFALRDPNGRLVSLSQYHGRVVLLTFIHSKCHDACPFMVEQIKGALGDLPASVGRVPAIGISVAPGEDTPANRRAFLAKHQMTGRLAFLSGSVPALRRVWRAYAIQPVTPKIDHSTFVILIDKRGFERVGFPADQLTPETLAHDILLLEREAA